MSVRSAPSTAPTMRDVATKAGVSPATVSLALRNHPAIRLDTRERVLLAQRELGYKLNRNAQQLGRQGRRSGARRLEVLSFVMSGISFEDGAYVPFLHGIVRESQARSIRVLTQSLESMDGSDSSLPSAVRDGHVDGVIVSGYVNDEVIAPLAQRKIPCVVLGNYAIETRVPRVEVDMRQVASLVVKKLVERNRRHFAFVLESAAGAYEQTILDGTRSALAQSGLSLPDSHVIATNPSIPSGMTFIDAYGKLDPKPTAVIAPNSLIAAECVTELRARGVKVPGQADVVSLVVSAQDARHKRFHMVNLALERAGKIAVQRLAETVEFPSSEPTITVLTADDWIPAAGSETPHAP